MFPDFEGTSGASSYDGKHAPGAAPSDWSYRIRRTISEHLREHSLGVLQKIEKGLWHSTRHTVKDQLRAARLPVAVQNAILGQVDGARWV